MEPVGSLKELLLQLEEKLLRPEIRKSAETIEETLDDNFIEFGSSGEIYDKQRVIETLQGESPRNISINDFNILEITPRVVIATYLAVITDPPGNKKNISLRSSIWKSIDGKWKIVFHQGTPLKHK